MRKTLSVGSAALMVVLGLAVTTSPALATEDCKAVTVTDRTGPDSGLHGDWATVTIDRKLTVCAKETPEEGDWTYTAKVEDSGEFVTLAGTSPGDQAKPLAVGLKGTVNGGFAGTFTAPKWITTEDLKTPAKDTATGEWVNTAVPGAKFNLNGSDWKWTYNLCGEHGEWWVNAEAGNSGDITGLPCPTPSESQSPDPSDSPDPTQSPTVEPSESQTQDPGTTISPTPTQSTIVAAPPMDNAGNGGSLPVTGSSKGALLYTVGFGVLLLSVGVSAFWWARKRRNAAFEA